MKFSYLLITAFSIILFSINFVPGQELRVVKTNPENGAANVDPYLEEITIVFSAQIKQNSWSFVETTEDVIPEIVGDPDFRDNRTCVLPVLLEPGTKYSIGINSATRKGFKSAADERISVTPFVLSFTTGQFDEETPPEIPNNRQPQSQKQLMGQYGGMLSKQDKNGVGSGSQSVPQTLIFQRVQEPRENAFSLLIPKGWQTEGGILRINPLTQGGPSQSIDAKLDFAVKKDAQGSVMARWLPDILYYDARMSPAGQMGMFPPGSNYQGMTVYPLMPAQQFLAQLVFPYLHPGVTGVQIIEQRSLPQLAQKYQQRVRSAIPQMTFSYDAAVLTVTYRENNITFKEKLFAVIENWGQLGAGMWGNKETFVIRAPEHEFDRWEAVISIMQNSVIVNSQWLMGEIQGQLKRAGIVIETQQELQRIEREIVSHRQKTMAEIHNDMFLTLTDQEEYVNPYTNQVEVGSNQWKHRWVNESGDVIYTDQEDYNPNVDIHLNRSDFKKTPARKRFPQE